MQPKDVDQQIRLSIEQYKLGLKRQSIGPARKKKKKKNYCGAYETISSYQDEIHFTSTEQER